MSTEARRRATALFGSAVGMIAIIGVLGMVLAPAAYAQAPAGSVPEESETPPPAGEPVAEEEGDAAVTTGAHDLFAATFVLGGARDRLTGDDPAFNDFEDDVYVAGADIALGGRLSERTDLALEYAPEYERFDSTDEDTLHHVAGARFARRLDPRFTLSLVGSYLDTDDPGRFLDDALLLVRRTPYRQATGRAGLDYRGQHAGMRLEVGRIDTRVEPSEGPFLLGLDQTDDIATLGIDRTIGPRAEIFASYSYVETEAAPLSIVEGIEPAAPLDEPIQQAMAGWRYLPRESVSLLLSGGVLDDGIDQSWIAAAEIEGRGRSSAFRLRYDRTAATLGGRIAGSDSPVGGPSGALVRGGVTDAATLGFTLGVGRRFQWEQELRAMRTELPGLLADDRLDSLAARTMLSLEAFRALEVFLAVDWFAQESDATPRAERLRATLGLRFGLVGPPRRFDVLAEPAAPSARSMHGTAYGAGGLR